MDLFVFWSARHRFDSIRCGLRVKVQGNQFSLSSRCDVRTVDSLFDQVNTSMSYQGASIDCLCLAEDKINACL